MTMNILKDESYVYSSDNDSYKSFHFEWNENFGSDNGM